MTLQKLLAELERIKISKTVAECSDDELLAAACHIHLQTLCEGGGPSPDEITRIASLSDELEKRIYEQPSLQDAFRLIVGRRNLVDAWDGDPGRFDDVFRYAKIIKQTLDEYELNPKLTDEQFAILAGIFSHALMFPLQRELTSKYNAILKKWETGDWESLDTLTRLQRFRAVALSEKIGESPAFQKAFIDLSPEVVTPEQFQAYTADEIVAQYELIEEMATEDFEKAYGTTVMLGGDTFDTLSSPTPNSTPLTEAKRLCFDFVFLEEDESEEFGSSPAPTSLTPEEAEMFLDILKRRNAGQPLNKLETEAIRLIDSQIDQLPAPLAKLMKKEILGYLEKIASGEWSSQSKASAGHDMAYQLKIQIEGVSKPPVWRRVVVPGTLPMSLLHTVIQAVFGWWDYHLYMFNNGRTYDYGDLLIKPADDFDEEDEIPPIDPTDITVGEVFSEHPSLRYVYDFGDYWTHRITVEMTFPISEFTRIRCIGGRGTTPHEDVGGVGGHEEMKKVMADPKHPDYKSYRKWLGLKRGEQYDPDAFSVGAANSALREAGFVQ